MSIRYVNTKVQCLMIALIWRHIMLNVEGFGVNLIGVGSGGVGSNRSLIWSELDLVSWKQWSS